MVPAMMAMPIIRTQMTFNLRPPRRLSATDRAPVNGIYFRTAMARIPLILVPGLLCDAAVWEHQARDLQSLTDITIPDHGCLDSFPAMADAILDRAPQR